MFVVPSKRSNVDGLKSVQNEKENRNSFRVDLITVSLCTLRNIPGTFFRVIFFAVVVHVGS